MRPELELELAREQIGQVALVAVADARASGSSKDETLALLHERLGALPAVRGEVARMDVFPDPTSAALLAVANRLAVGERVMAGVLEELAELRRRETQADPAVTAALSAVGEALATIGPEIGAAMASALERLQPVIEVNVPEQPAPIVQVTTEPVVTVQAPDIPIEVNVNVPEPVVNVTVETPPTRKDIVVERDSKGRAVGYTVEEVQE